MSVPQAHQIIFNFPLLSFLYESESVSHSVMSNFATPWTVVACQARVSMELPRQEYSVGSHFLLQGIFLTQGSNPGLLHCRRILYRLSHQGSPRFLYRCRYWGNRFYFWILHWLFVHLNMYYYELNFHPQISDD